MKDTEHSKVIFSIDFAIINDYEDDAGIIHQEYIRFNKKQNSYSWVEQPQGYYLLSKKEDWIKNNGYWMEVRERYLEKKNKNDNLKVHSKSIYAATVNEICQKHGFFE